MIFICILSYCQMAIKNSLNFIYSKMLANLLKFYAILYKQYYMLNIEGKNLNDIEQAH